MSEDFTEDIPITTADVFLPEMLHDTIFALADGCATCWADPPVVYVRVEPRQSPEYKAFIVRHGDRERRFVLLRGQLPTAVEAAVQWIRDLHGAVAGVPA